MTPSDAEFLKVYVLLAPLLLVGFALMIVATTRWLDKREARRRAEGRPPRWGIDYLYAADVIGRIEPELFDSQADLFETEMTLSAYRPDLDKVRARLQKILAELRAASNIRWTRTRSWYTAPYFLT